MTRFQDERPRVLFAGGGTGGHIYPNVAVLEALQAMGRGCRPHFMVSDRKVDASVMAEEGLEYSTSGARPLGLDPRRWLGFARGWRRAERQAAELIRTMGAQAAVVSGGFVSGPVVTVAKRMGVPVAVVNLDAVPGKANRWLARRASRVFSVYPHPLLPDAEPIGYPLRTLAKEPWACWDARGEVREAARAELGLQPGRRTLLVCGGSQGAGTINEAMPLALAQPATLEALRGWQVLHLSGAGHDHAVRADYRKAGLEEKLSVLVLPYLRRIGLAWASAELAVSRSGAGSVAECWHHAVPTLFMPYPHHRDQHQRWNAAPLEALGGARIVGDSKEKLANAAALGPVLAALAHDADQRSQMANALERTRPRDGATAVARWLAEAIGSRP